MIIPFPPDPAERRALLKTQTGNALVAAIAALELDDFERAGTLAQVAHKGLVALERTKPK